MSCAKVICSSIAVLIKFSLETGKSDKWMELTDTLSETEFKFLNSQSAKKGATGAINPQIVSRHS